MASEADQIALENDILQALSSGPIADSLEFAASRSVDHERVVGVLNSLSGDLFVVLKPQTRSVVTLTDDGREYLELGTPEYRVHRAVADAAGDISMDQVKDAVGAAVFKPGWGKCMRNKWLKYDKKAGKVLLLKETVEDATHALLAAVANGVALKASDTRELKKRNMIIARERTYWAVTKGPSFATKRQRYASELTRDMLDSGEWKSAEFKDLNLAAKGKEISGGHLHPLLKVRTEFRSMLLEMGFEEMPTAKFVESSFWNFDALFQPQSHPARDAHDTFFLTAPQSTLRLPEDYVARVKKMHEEGGSGSIGYGYKWKRSEADANLLRTHTTAVSAQMLYRVAQQKSFKPIKLFSIDRVFRNETMDATHLAEFHQVEGVVADYNLSLGDLIGVITEFFKRMGITQLRFKPAYNPYTEPSMEIFGYHPQLKKWTEIGNSGIFRPEMLAPMGLPPSVRVIAWGISLERPTMIRYKIDNIRTLFGHKVKVTKTRASPLCRFDSTAANTTPYDGATRAEGSGRPDTLPSVEE